MRKPVTIAILMLLVSVASYYAAAVMEARQFTADNVKRARSGIVVPLYKSDLTEVRLQQLLRVQDENFFRHGGTDFLSGRVTTITQGLVKLLYFDKFRPGLAKIKQSLIARFALDPLVSKEDQLHLFLSLAGMGSRNGIEVRGFGQASEVYFGKSFADISQDEFLALLAMLTCPDSCNVTEKPAKNAEKVAQIKHKIAGIPE